MTFHFWKHRISRPIKQLNWRDVRLEEAMRDESFKRLLIRHQRLRLTLIEVTEQMPYAVAAIQRASYDVVQA
ncbi:hypothetical protein [Stutzerimonas stutzeri]|uniref:hypothetical protein n=1 Tax=Stutzerimonas stutzeri TaxID=316 RepID=UPI0019096329|nr:hypothetical protein [Stutzerimonas stutzeri]